MYRVCSISFQLSQLRPFKAPPVLTGVQEAQLVPAWSGMAGLDSTVGQHVVGYANRRVSEHSTGQKASSVSAGHKRCA